MFAAIIFDWDGTLAYMHAFVDPEHEEELYRMIERAIRKKG